MIGNSRQKRRDWQPTFAPQGRLLEQGDTINRVAYAQTLAAIAQNGSEAFYYGPIAESIVRKVKLEGGIISLEDLASYRVVVRHALEGTYLGRKIYTTHAPTSGPVFLHMLNLLEHYDFNGDGRTSLNTHRTIEALKCESSHNVLIQTILIKNSRIWCKVITKSDSGCNKKLKATFMTGLSYQILLSVIKRTSSITSPRRNTPTSCQQI